MALLLFSHHLSPAVSSWVGYLSQFDQMTVHSASSNALSDYSRYVLFTTFLDISAGYAL